MQFHIHRKIANITNHYGVSLQPNHHDSFLIINAGGNRQGSRPRFVPLHQPSPMPSDWRKTSTRSISHLRVSVLPYHRKRLPGKPWWSPDLSHFFHWATLNFLLSLIAGGVFMHMCNVMYILNIKCENIIYTVIYLRSTNRRDPNLALKKILNPKTDWVNGELYVLTVHLFPSAKELTQSFKKGSWKTTVDSSWVLGMYILLLQSSLFQISMSKCDSPFLLRGENLHQASPTVTLSIPPTV